MLKFLCGFTIDGICFFMLCIKTVCLEILYLIFRNRPKKEIKNSHILITGSGSGIGKLMAKKMACDGNTLHLVDINIEENDKNIKELVSNDCKIHTYYCDVGKLESITEMHTKVMENAPHVDYLFNNAGIIIGKLLPETSIKEMDLVMRVNALGAMFITHTFLDGMLKSGGHLIYTVSIGGLLGAPFLSLYCASKHAITGFVRNLLLDFEYMGISHVKVTAVFPHFTNTGLVTGATVKLPYLFPLMETEWVADQIITATREEREELVLPRVTNYIPPLMYFTTPSVFRRFCVWFGNDLMKTFRQTRQHNLNPE